MSDAHYDIPQWIEDLQSEASARNTILSKWEMDFVEKVSAQWEESEYLTEGQTEKLKEIWEKI